MRDNPNYYFLKKCNRNVLINLTPYTHLISLFQKRLREKDGTDKAVFLSTSEFIGLMDSEKAKTCDSLYSDDDVIKINILAHGCAGLNYIPITVGNRKENISLDNFSSILAHFIGSKKVVVNLIVCNAGVGVEGDYTTNLDKSFAADLHENLAIKLNRDIPVVARKSAVALMSYNNTAVKVTGDLDKRRRAVRHKQPGSKTVYSLDGTDNQQIAQDAYQISWKRDVLMAIDKSLSKTKVPEKISLLEVWKLDFVNKAPEEIYKILDEEIKNEKSVLKKHNSRLTSLFKDPDSYVVIADLAARGKEIFDSRYTLKDPIYTGKNIK